MGRADSNLPTTVVLDAMGVLYRPAMQDLALLITANSPTTGKPGPDAEEGSYR